MEEIMRGWKNEVKETMEGVRERAGEMVKREDGGIEEGYERVDREIKGGKTGNAGKD